MYINFKFMHENSRFYAIMFGTNFSQLIEYDINQQIYKLVIWIPSCLFMLNVCAECL